MEVILLEKVRNLGKLGERVRVKSGYGRNFLVPQGKAVYATEGNVTQFEARRAELEAKEADALSASEARKQALLALGTVIINAVAGEEGRLFGSIGTRDIAAAITEAGVEIHRSEVALPMGVLRQTGEYDIEIELHSDVAAVIKIVVTSA